MDIYLTELRGEPEKPDGYELRFPTLPQEVSISTTATFQSYNIINLGNTVLPDGTDLKSITWDGTLYGTGREECLGTAMREWQDPEDVSKRIQGWEESHQKLRLNITETWINYDVYVKSFKPQLTGGFGDISYSLELTEARLPQILVSNPKASTTIPPQVVANDTKFICDTTMDVSITQGGKYTAMVYCTAGRPNVVAGTGGVVDITLKSRKNDNWYFQCTAKGTVGKMTGVYINGSKQPIFHCSIAAKSINFRGSAAVTSSKKTYTVAGSDTIWYIAVKMYQDGNQWAKIYNANKTLIEAVARAHGKSASERGRYLFPGTKLIIP
ncbi:MULTISPECIES: LysM peptidoglycan-binding domain-containing protein [Caproicibacterium]|uniref:LysM peptidoglycan-binding domain-containing protein n=1 Tax=Caproicibacterium argilliputei TaxID=3030016 RepID=A0AA97DAX2_9FIRM|nr:LysM peptidoglycan-binding domain-containing protein [Caproicibacterium argilliputei]WOC33484.1 LysM peptidoglycan-binding domain-containing protein [Caproicibacterium argilliputei]